MRIEGIGGRGPIYRADRELLRGVLTSDPRKPRNPRYPRHVLTPFGLVNLGQGQLAGDEYDMDGYAA